MKHLIIPLMLLLGTGPALAETRYVTDIFQITLRSGKSTQNEILRMLPSGTALKVLEVDQSSGYTRVSTPGGKEGWVLTRFLMKEQAARERLAAAEKRAAELELENRKMVTAVQSIREEMGGLQSERSNLEELKSRLVSLERNLQTLQQENENLRDRTARDWFMVGAGVVLLGIIVGLIIPRIRWRKKSSWGDTF